MKNLYLSSAKFDENLTQYYGLNEAILMENAANAIENLVRKKLTKGSRLLVISGGGNNGADGLCVARKLAGDYEVSVMLVSDKLNDMAKFQLNILKKLGVDFIFSYKEEFKFDCFIDAIFGSGFHGELSNEIVEILDTLNSQKGLKIAVDIPTGIDKFGGVKSVAFVADYTVTMGALKLGLFGDLAKDFVGKIKVANLGVSKTKFQSEKSPFYLLEKSDLTLPNRTKQNTNKGDFGHLYIASGEMSGASIMAGLAANAFGTGLVSLVSSEYILNLPPFLMQKSSFKDAKCVVIGPGLGDAKFDLKELTNKKVVIDADLCYRSEILEILDENFVITPHPKEFVSLLKLANIADISVSDLQFNRFKYAQIWSEKFRSVLVLKGANTIIVQNEKLFVSNFGSPALSKGGSGDVLAGMIGALLAQNYSVLNASISSVIAHGLAAQKFRANLYGLNPLDIIEELKWL
ncbi:bifunctional ADP-dependent NAD(P)H-hydrate dehydratase/NAD(P)H-hydrate epimerase [Campylobacter corcagiensis]|uniref:Bifunctional NAD(P)H-hydrate repair enzyme n=1 Tax=Campylobacter corcagiensis TaxID=1448857 RepID=A0A7M1LGT4_9BACT|nr:bifunctional ADP-dependent NAD(P)H-hydrate dehydratase/NAD(P)H-hydrate epimerase [Campylobacter corcagiensis]QKF63984.1 carbohydrate kinase, YjeF-related protein [Campylobacter corcagiensis]QOQ87812.1 bifunctional ADP-dependent NAD(P)H-hydrate dehydratase/NAD(P)H-hydrate epimerase [Campylobacter corcagiensis]